MKPFKSKHDQFLSKSLELLPIAVDFFKQHLPISLKSLIDFSTLERVDRKNTDKRLKQRQRDIIYKAALLNKTGTCFLALEHHSQEKWNIPLRLLQYQVDNLYAHMHAGNRDWPVVVSILLYHGKKSPYPRYSESTHYYKNPELGNQYLYFKFHVIDLTQISDEEIITHGLCAPVELLLKHSRDADFELPIEAYRDVFHTCIQKVGDEYIETMLSYAAWLSDLKVGEKMYNFIEEVLENKKEIVMTYAQKLQREGRQETRRETRRETRQEVAKDMLLSLHLDINIVQQATKLPKVELEKILHENNK